MTNLSKGSRGEEVRRLQKKLGIEADGIFGPDTDDAVRDYQRKRGLEVDGVAGPITMGNLNLLRSLWERFLSLFRRD